MSEVLQYSNHPGGWGRHVLLCSTIKCSWNYSPARCWDTAAASGEVRRKIIIYLLVSMGKSHLSCTGVGCPIRVCCVVYEYYDYCRRWWFMLHGILIWRIDIILLSSTDAAEIIDKVSSKINIIRLSWFSGMHLKVYPVYRMSHIICPSYSVLLGRMSYFLTIISVSSLLSLCLSFSPSLLPATKKTINCSLTTWLFLN